MGNVSWLEEKQGMFLSQRPKHYIHTAVVIGEEFIAEMGYNNGARERAVSLVLRVIVKYFMIPTFRRPT